MKRMMTLLTMGCVMFPVSFVGNGSSFLSVTDAFETNASTVETFDIRDYGARESDLLQTKTIQSAIDAAAAVGGGEVVIFEDRFRTGGLVLKSGVTLRLEDGAELMGDANPDNYPGSNRWYRALIRADGARNVASARRANSRRFRRVRSAMRCRSTTRSSHGRSSPISSAAPSRRPPPSPACALRSNA